MPEITYPPNVDRDAWLDDYRRCPFCGSLALIAIEISESVEESLEGDGYTAIHCQVCKAQAPIDVWNMRTEES